MIRNKIQILIDEKKRTEEKKDSYKIILFICDAGNLKKGIFTFMPFCEVSPNTLLRNTKENAPITRSMPLLRFLVPENWRFSQKNKSKFTLTIFL
jgi:hypothetical protein